MADTAIRGGSSAERPNTLSTPGPRLCGAGRCRPHPGHHVEELPVDSLATGISLVRNGGTSRGWERIYPAEFPPVRLAAKQSREDRLTGFSRNSVVIGCFGRW